MPGASATKEGGTHAPAAVGPDDRRPEVVENEAAQGGCAQGGRHEGAAVNDDDPAAALGNSNPFSVQLESRSLGRVRELDAPRVPGRGCPGLQTPSPGLGALDVHPIEEQHREVQADFGTRFPPAAMFFAGTTVENDAEDGPSDDG